MLVSFHDEHEANNLSQTKNDSNSQSHSKSAIENWLRKKLLNGLIDIDYDELNTYKPLIHHWLAKMLLS